MQKKQFRQIEQKKTRQQQDLEKQMKEREKKQQELKRLESERKKVQMEFQKTEKTKSKGLKDLKSKDLEMEQRLIHVELETQTSMKEIQRLKEQLECPQEYDARERARQEERRQIQELHSRMDNMQQDLERVSGEKAQLHNENEELRKVVDALTEKLAARNQQFQEVLSSRAMQANGDNNGQVVDDQLVEGTKGPTYNDLCQGRVGLPTSYGSKNTAIEDLTKGQIELPSNYGYHASEQDGTLEPPDKPVTKGPTKYRSRELVRIPQGRTEEVLSKSLNIAEGAGSQRSSAPSSGSAAPRSGPSVGVIREDAASCSPVPPLGNWKMTNSTEPPATGNLEGSASSSSTTSGSGLQTSGLSASFQKPSSKVCRQVSAPDLRHEVGLNRASGGYVSLRRLPLAGQLESGLQAWETQPISSDPHYSPGVPQQRYSQAMQKVPDSTKSQGSQRGRPVTVHRREAQTAVRPPRTTGSPVRPTKGPAPPYVTRQHSPPRSGTVTPGFTPGVTPPWPVTMPMQTQLRGPPFAGPIPHRT